MKEQIKKKKNKGPEPWIKNSKGKELARSLLQDNPNSSYHAMDCEMFGNLSSLFQQYPFKNFKSNINRLKERIADNKRHVEANEANLRHDQSIIPLKMVMTRGDPQWDQHNARKHLKNNIAAKKHEIIKPRELWRSRNEYQEFHLNVF